MMAENMTLDNETRKELIKTALGSLDYENYKKVFQNVSLIHEENRFFNWYNGFSKISLPKFTSSYGPSYLKTNLETVSTSGVIMSRGFGEIYDPKNVLQGQDSDIILITPNLTNSKEDNVTLLIKIEVEKLNIIEDGFNSVERLKFNSLDVKDKKETTLTLSLPAQYKLHHYYSLSDINWKDLMMEKMPGFRMSFRYSIDVVPERKFFNLDANNAFNRFCIKYLFINPTSSTRRTLYKSC